MKSSGPEITFGLERHNAPYAANRQNIATSGRLISYSDNLLRPVNQKV
ncbi:MAG TPA: hypothetical protein VKD65_05415 [Candidatus Angelobacter sp.]|nr:hypothetical protein [Candidatus Angelobacter sp.]